MPPRRWTTEELETANIMMGEGASFSDIAKKLDRTASAVESKLKGKKLPPAGQRRPNRSLWLTRRLNQRKHQQPPHSTRLRATSQMMKMAQR